MTKRLLIVNRRLALAPGSRRVVLFDPATGAGGECCCGASTPLDCLECVKETQLPPGVCSIRGTDGNVYQQYWTAAGGWKGWFNIGAPPGGFAGAPATISRNKDVCNVYVRGNDNKLWQRPYYNGQWHDWAKHANGVLASEPTLGSMGPDHEHVFVRGTDGNVYTNDWNDGIWKYAPIEQYFSYYPYIYVIRLKPKSSK